MQRDKGDGRILLGDNTGCGAIVLRPIGVLCIGVGFFNCTSSSTACTRILTPTPTEFDFRRAFRNATTALIWRVSFGHVTADGWGYEVVCINDGHSGSVSPSNNEEMKMELKLN
jgi:hypothetical protein